MLVKTHLIVTDQWDDFNVKWIKPLLKVEEPIVDDDGLTFILISKKGRTEIKTFDINYIERIAKEFCYPHGRESLTVDNCYIYVKTKKEEEMIGVIKKYHTKKYAPMYDDIDI